MQQPAQQLQKTHTQAHINQSTLQQSHQLISCSSHLPFFKQLSFKDKIDQKIKSSQNHSQGDDSGQNSQDSESLQKNQQNKKEKKKLKIQQKMKLKSRRQTQKTKEAGSQSFDVVLSSQEKNQTENQKLQANNHQQIISKVRNSRTVKQSYKYQNNSQDQIEPFKFPFVNNYIEKHGELFLQTLDVIDKAKQHKQPNASGTFLNCDVRYFNWELFIQEVGKFDVLIIDPPWRIKGAQQNDSQFMFSNCKFSLQYNTMGNSQIARIPLQLISDEGFIFLWILNSQLDSSVEIMQGWGYELIQQLAWVKLRDQKIYLTHGYYFMHSYEICLIGYKNNKEKKTEKQKQKLKAEKIENSTKQKQVENISSSFDKLKLKGKINGNALFAQVRKKSQKPQDLYSIIQMMFPGKKKVQIFARNHNLRYGVFSIGNQLGESYDKWMLSLNCDKCKHAIQFGTKRYKSKTIANYDLCSKCVQTQNIDKFYQISNQVDEDIRHEYVACDHCKTQPIWGIRFHCLGCQNFDICQSCFDKNLQSQQKFHSVQHEFKLLEVPVFGNGFHIHQVKCFACYQNPIIGVYFNCTSCKNYKLCQKCYFQRPALQNPSKTHRPQHQMQAIFQSQQNHSKIHECFNCKIQIVEDCWMCQNCYNFFFCQKCFDNKNSFKSLYANTHKKYHVYTKIF